MEAKIYPEYSTHYPLLLTNFMKNPLRLYPNDIGVVYRMRLASTIDSPGVSGTSAPANWLMLSKLWV